MREIWKDIKGYEELYQASNLGRIKSLQRKVWNGYSYVTHKERILKPRYNNKGYVTYALFKDNKRKDFKGHFLIANTFLKNIPNKPFINHKDGKKDNNNIFNLEWCTLSENSIHALENHLFKTRKRRYKCNKQDSKECLNKYRKKAIEKARQVNSIPILEINDKGNIIKEFNSCRDAERFYNIRIHIERNNKRFIKKQNYKGEIYG